MIAFAYAIVYDNTNICHSNISEFVFLNLNYLKNNILVHVLIRLSNDLTLTHFYLSKYCQYIKRRWKFYKEKKNLFKFIRLTHFCIFILICRYLDVETCNFYFN